VASSVNKLRSAKGALQQYGQTNRQVHKQIGTTNKSIATGNQLFFSMGDLAQDSAQFSMGWSQGMRAIGNNIGFTAELMASLSRRAKEANVTFGSALKQSFLGVGGALLVLNLATTAATVLLDKFSKKGKEASEAIGDFANEFSSLREAGSYDFLDILSMQNQVKGLRVLSSEIEGFSDKLSIKV
jgi:hypothetical protein